MTALTIQKLADSCVRVEVGGNAALIDPGFYTWGHDALDLSAMTPPDRLLITHNHKDHLSTEFVSALVAAFPEMAIETNDEVIDQLASEGVAASADSAQWTSQFSAPHEQTPMGSQPVNVGFVVGGVFAHPGDSYTFDVACPVLALPVLPPWGSATEAVALARRLRPRYVVPIHDWYLTPGGKRWLYGAVEPVLAAEDIAMLRLEDFESVTVDVD